MRACGRTRRMGTVTPSIWALARLTPDHDRTRRLFASTAIDWGGTSELETTA